MAPGVAADEVVEVGSVDGGSWVDFVVAGGVCEAEFAGEVVDGAGVAESLSHGCEVGLCAGGVGSVVEVAEVDVGCGGGVGGAEADVSGHALLVSADDGPVEVAAAADSVFGEVGSVAGEVGWCAEDEEFWVVGAAVEFFFESDE